MQEENLITNEDSFEQHIADRSFSLLAVNYAFHKTIDWGGQQWKLKEKDLEEIRNGIDIDVEKTGRHVWGWFHNKWKDFCTFKSYSDIGEDFIGHLKKYYV